MYTASTERDVFRSAVFDLCWKEKTKFLHLVHCDGRRVFGGAPEMLLRLFVCGQRTLTKNHRFLFLRVLRKASVRRALLPTKNGLRGIPKAGTNRLCVVFCPSPRRKARSVWRATRRLLNGPLSVKIVSVAVVFNFTIHFHIWFKCFGHKHENINESTVD